MLAVSKCFPAAKFRLHYSTILLETGLPSVLFVFFGPETFMQKQCALVEAASVGMSWSLCTSNIYSYTAFQGNLQYVLKKAAFTPPAQCWNVCEVTDGWAASAGNMLEFCQNTFSVGCLDFSLLDQLSLSNHTLVSVFTGCGTFRMIYIAVYFLNVQKMYNTLT